MGINLPVIIAAIAIAISVISIIFSMKVHRDSLNSTIITQAYSLFNEGIKILLENSFLTHLFVMPENYPEVKLLVQNSIRELDTNQNSELILKERAMALYAFQIFEYFHYQSEHSRSVNAKDRIDFLNMVLTYLTRRLLRNPRLLYYWSESGGNLNVYFERVTREYFNREVIGKLSGNVEEIMDCDGPFQGGQGRNL